MRIRRGSLHKRHQTYYYDRPSFLLYRPSVRDARLYPITTDGVYKVVFNGVPDWVYEGETIYYNEYLFYIGKSVLNSVLNINVCFHCVAGKFNFFAF